MTTAPGPGWYADPNDPSTNRYWDGTQWTENRAPIIGASAVTNVKDQHADGIIVTGYILAVLIPFVGFIVGLTQINRNRHGIWIVVVSIAAFFIWLAVVSAGAASEASNSYSYR